MMYAIIVILELWQNRKGAIEKLKMTTQREFYASLAVKIETSSNVRLRTASSVGFRIMVESGDVLISKDGKILMITGGVVCARDLNGPIKKLWIDGQIMKNISIGELAIKSDTLFVALNR